MEKQCTPSPLGPGHVPGDGVGAVDKPPAGALPYMTFPKEHRAKLHSTNPIERLNGAVLLEQNDEWAMQRARYMTLETIRPLGNDKVLLLSAVAA